MIGWGREETPEQMPGSEHVNLTSQELGFDFHLQVLAILNNNICIIDVCQIWSCVNTGWEAEKGGRKNLLRGFRGMQNAWQSHNAREWKMRVQSLPRTRAAPWETGARDSAEIPKGLQCRRKKNQTWMRLSKPSSPASPKTKMMIDPLFTWLPDEH